MELSKMQIIMSLAEVLLYGAMLVFLGVMRKKGAGWTKKLSVRVTGVFAVIKVLGELVTGFGYLAMEQSLFGMAAEQYTKVLSISMGIVDAVTGSYMFAMLLLSFIYLGKVDSPKKK